MTPREISETISRIWRDTLPESRLSMLDQVRKLIPAEMQPTFDAMVDVAKDIGLAAPPPLIIVSLHGIRTDGAWQTKFRYHLGNIPNVSVVPLGYGFFSVLGLLGPFRKKPVEDVEKKIQDIRTNNQNADVVMVAHSFGTYIVSRLLIKNQTLNIKRLLMCGSVVRRNYEWEKLPAQYNRGTVINEVGTRDLYPVLASAGTFGYGATGRFGFQGPRVYDRFFDFGHSDFFDDSHFQKYWKPFILDGIVIESDWDHKRTPSSWGVGLLTMWPGMLLTLALGGAAIVSACAFTG